MTVGLLARRLPAMPYTLKQVALALCVLLGGVAGVDLSGLSIHDLIRPVGLLDGVGHMPSLSARWTGF